MQKPLFLLTTGGRALYDSGVMNRVHSYREGIYTIITLGGQHALSTLLARENALYFCALPTDLKIKYLFTNEGEFL